MQPPLFWARPRAKRGILPLVLSPLAALWTAVTRRRLRKGAWEKMPVPVVCVGNINAGGTGKTPSVIALLALLQEAGIVAHVVSRGYGGTVEGPLQVNERQHSADLVGDEPLQISAFGPCWVAQDRAAGIRAAAAAGAEMVLLDDGFQNPAVFKDLSIVVVDAETGFANGCVMPAGPLREPVRDGLNRGDVLLTIGGDAAQERLEKDWPEIAGMERWRAELRPLAMGINWQGMRCLAFAGIGRPGKFFNALRAEGAELVATRAFPDHAPYPDAVLQRLAAEAWAAGAHLVTTEKDVARLPRAFKPEVMAFPVRLAFADASAVTARLNALVRGSKRLDK